MMMHGACAVRFGDHDACTDVVGLIHNGILPNHTVCLTAAGLQIGSACDSDGILRMHDVGGGRHLEIGGSPAFEHMGKYDAGASFNSEAPDVHVSKWMCCIFEIMVIEKEGVSWCRTPSPDAAQTTCQDISSESYSAPKPLQLGT
jgi:hypothetical protein